MKSGNALMLAGVMALAASLFAQGPRRDGRWEVKTEIQMAGMTMPPQTTTQCISKQDAADPLKSMPQSGRGANPTDCKVSDYKVDGNKVTWSLTCEREGMTTSGELVYEGETFTGTTKISTQGPEMTMKFSGKRLGDCTK